MEERLTVVDIHDREIGIEPRSVVRSKNLLHRGVAILVFNSRGELYVHRRTESKDIFPGMYDMFVGGAVTAGESYEEAARREAFEELGVVNGEWERLFTYRYEGRLNRAIVKVYRVTFDGPVRLQEEEVAWGAFYPLNEVVELLDRLSFVSDGEEIFREYLRRK